MCRTTDRVTWASTDSFWWTRGMAGQTTALCTASLVLVVVVHVPLRTHKGPQAPATVSCLRVGGEPSYKIPDSVIAQHPFAARANQVRECSPVVWCRNHQTVAEGSITSLTPREMVWTQCMSPAAHVQVALAQGHLNPIDHPRQLIYRSCWRWPHLQSVHPDEVLQQLQESANICHRSGPVDLSAQTTYPQHSQTECAGL
jgi:hypothetical protein